MAVERLPFKLTRPDADTFAADAEDIGYKDKTSSKDALDNLFNNVLTYLEISETGNLFNCKINNDGSISDIITNVSVHYFEVQKGDIVSINVSTSVTSSPLNVVLYNTIPSTSVTSENIIEKKLDQEFGVTNSYMISANGYLAFSCRREGYSAEIKKGVSKESLLSQQLNSYITSNNAEVGKLSKCYGYFTEDSTMPIDVCKNLNEVIARLEVRDSIAENLFISRILINKSTHKITLYIDGASSNTRYLSAYNIIYDDTTNVFEYVGSGGVKITINIALVDTSLAIYSNSTGIASNYAIINTEKCRYTSSYPFEGAGLFDDYVRDIRISGADWVILNPAGSPRLENVFYVKKYDADNDKFIIGTKSNKSVYLTLDMIDSETYEAEHTTTSPTYGTYVSKFTVKISKKPAYTIDDTNAFSVISSKILSDYYVNYQNSITISRLTPLVDKSNGYFLGSSTMAKALCENLNEAIVSLEVRSSINENLYIERFTVSNSTLVLYIKGVTSGTKHLSAYNLSYDANGIFEYVASSGIIIRINMALIDRSISFYSSAGLQNSSFCVINTEKCRYNSSYPFTGEGIFDLYVRDIKISGKDWLILNPSGSIRLDSRLYVKKYDATNDRFVLGTISNKSDFLTLNYDSNDNVYKGTYTQVSSLYGTYSSDYVIKIFRKPSRDITDTNAYSVISEQVSIDCYNNYLNSISYKRAEDATDWSYMLQNYQWFWSSCNCLPFMVKAANSKGPVASQTTGTPETFPALCIFLNNDTHYTLASAGSVKVQGFEGSLVREHGWAKADKSAFEVLHSYLALGDIMNIGDWTKQQWKDQWLSYWDYIDNHAKSPQLVCIGNHDINQDMANVFVVPYDSPEDTGFTWDNIQWACKAEQRQYIIQPMLDRYKTALGIVEDVNNSNACYYYFDGKYQDSRESTESQNKFLRMIIMDVYDFPDTWDAETHIKEYGYWNANGSAPSKHTEAFSLAQIKFLVSALSDAITNGLDVCLCSHDFSITAADTIFEDYANKGSNSFVYTDLAGNSDTITYDFTGSNGKLFFLHGHTHRWKIEKKCGRYAYRLVSAEGMGGPRKYVHDTADILVYDERGIRFTRYGDCPRQMLKDASGDLLGFHFVDSPVDPSEFVE